MVMQSGKQMEQYGVKKGDGIVMGMDKLRYRLTRTHSYKNKEKYPTLFNKP